MNNIQPSVHHAHVQPSAVSGSGSSGSGTSIFTGMFMANKGSRISDLNEVGQVLQKQNENDNENDNDWYYTWTKY